MRMFPASADSYPCLRLDFPVTPEVCEQRARQWVAEGRKRPTCAGTACTHYKAEWDGTPPDPGPKLCPLCGKEMGSFRRTCGECHQRRIRLMKMNVVDMAAELEVPEPDPLPPCRDCGKPAMSATAHLCKSCRARVAQAAGQRVKEARKAPPVEREPLPEGLHYTRSGKVARGTNYMHRCPGCGEWTRKDRGQCSACKGTLHRTKAGRQAKAAPPARPSKVLQLKELAVHQIAKWQDTGDRDALVDAFAVLYAYFLKLNKTKGGATPNTGREPVRTP